MTNQAPPQARNSRASLRVFLLAASFTLLSANGAMAQEGGYPGPEDEGDWKFSVSANFLYMSAFTGSDDYQLMAFPDISVEYKDRFFASLFDGIGYNVISTENWRIGPIAKLDFGRQEDDSNPFRLAGDKTTALLGLGDIDPGFELGGFVEYNLDPLSAKVELRKAVTGHDGLVGEASVSYTGFTETMGKPIMYSFGPRLLLGDSKYNNAYYGVNATQSANSGLPEYSADFSLVSYGVEAFAMAPLAGPVSVGLFGAYDRLTGDAADSPLITMRGKKDQFMGGLRFSYDF